MEQTTFNEADRRERVRKFWKKTKGRDRTSFLFLLQEEGISRNTIYKYARESFQTVSGITIRGIDSCIKEFKEKKTGYNKYNT